MIVIFFNHKIIRRLKMLLAKSFAGIDNCKIYVHMIITPSLQFEKRNTLGATNKNEFGRHRASES